MSRSRLADVAEGVSASSDDNYDDDDYDAEDAGRGGGRRGGDGDDAEDARRGAAVLLGATSAETKEGAAALVRASQGLWGTLYGGTALAKPGQRYHRCVVLRVSRDKTYSVKYMDGEKRASVHAKYFQVPADVRKRDRADWIKRHPKELRARKPAGFNKSRMNDMATPSVLRKDKKGAKPRKKFASEEDERECTFGKLKKSKRRAAAAGGTSDESKENADFLVRMEAKETARRAEIERKKKEAKNLLRKSRSNTKKWTDEDGEKFLNRLAKAEQKKKENYKKLQKQLRPAFQISERKVYNPDTGKIETHGIEHAPPDPEGFLRRLEEDEQLRKAKMEKRLGERLAATAMPTPGRRTPGSPAQFNNTHEY